jgi:hypothetical protein
MNWIPLLLCYFGVMISLAGDSTDRPVLRVLGRCTSSISVFGYASNVGTLSLIEVAPALIAAVTAAGATELLLLHPADHAVRWQLGSTVIEHLLWSAALTALGVDPIGALAGAVGGLWLMTLVGDGSRSISPEHRGLLLLAAAAAFTTLVCAAGAYLGGPGPSRPAPVVAASLLVAGRAAGLHGQLTKASPILLGLTLPLGYGGQLLFVWAAAPR